MTLHLVDSRNDRRISHQSFHIRLAKVRNPNCFDFSGLQKLLHCFVCLAASQGVSEELDMRKIIHRACQSLPLLACPIALGRDPLRVSRQLANASGINPHSPIPGRRGIVGEHPVRRRGDACCSTALLWWRALCAGCRFSWSPDLLPFPCSS